MYKKTSSIISGGSIGGLSTSLVLPQDGYPVTVFGASMQQAAKLTRATWPWQVGNA